MIEQLNATELRIAQETAIGSGETAGNWWRPRSTMALASRSLALVASRSDLWRQPSERVIIGDSWTLKTTHQVGLDWLAWLLRAHANERLGNVWTLDPEAEGPTYVVETEMQDGGRATFGGLKLQELRIFWEESRVIRLDCQWSGLWRSTPESALPAYDIEPVDAVAPTSGGAFSASTSAFVTGPPRLLGKVQAHAFQVFLSRAVEAADFGPDGVASTHTRRAWQVVGEVVMPWHTIAETAISGQWSGQFAIWFGAGNDRLVVGSVEAHVVDQDLQAYDFRQAQLLFQAHTDTRRSLLDFYSYTDPEG